MLPQAVTTITLCSLRGSDVVYRTFHDGCEGQVVGEELTKGHHHHSTGVVHRAVSPRLMDYITDPSCTGQLLTEHTALTRNPTVCKVIYGMFSLNNN